MAKSNTHEPAVLVQQITTVVPAANTNYDFNGPSFPSGLYQIALMVTSTFGVADGAIEVVALNGATTPAETTDKFFLEDMAATSGAASWVPPAASEVHLLHVYTGPAAVDAGAERTILLPDGFRVKVTRGTAANAGDPCTILVIAKRL